MFPSIQPLILFHWTPGLVPPFLTAHISLRGGMNISHDLPGKYDHSTNADTVLKKKERRGRGRNYRSIVLLLALL
jgi:hypothetical protein